MDLEFIEINTPLYKKKQCKQHNNRDILGNKLIFLSILKAITFYNLNMEIYGKCN